MHRMLSDFNYNYYHNVLSHPSRTDHVLDYQCNQFQTLTQATNDTNDNNDNNATNDTNDNTATTVHTNTTQYYYLIE